MNDWSRPTWRTQIDPNPPAVGLIPLPCSGRSNRYRDTHPSPRRASHAAVAILVRLVVKQVRKHSGLGSKLPPKDLARKAMPD